MRPFSKSLLCSLSAAGILVSAAGVSGSGDIEEEMNGLPSAEQQLREIEDLVAQGEMSEVVPRQGLAKSLAIPASYDRSLEKAQPPIRGQSGGSCTGWATTYYGATWVIAKREGWDAAAGGDEYRLSPHWTYNFVNGGTDGGSSNSYCNEVLKKHGAASWKSFYPPTTTSGTRRATVWCSDPAVWRQAVAFRFDSSKTIRDIDTPAGLEILKQHLLNNLYTITYGTNSPTSGTHWQFLTIKDDPATAADNPFVGQKGCYYVQSNHGGSHAMAVVGWNDDIWIDVNQNGTVDAGEKGALKVSESHGVTKVNSNQGYYWLAYDALHDLSLVVNGPNTERSAAFSNRLVTCGRAKDAYTPRLLAQFSLKSAARDDIQLRFLRTDPQATAPYRTPKASWQGYVFGTWKRSEENRLGFDGNSYTESSSAPQATFVFDLTDIAPPASEAAASWKYVMVAKDMDSALDLTVQSFTLIDPLSNTSVSAASLPFTVDKDSGYAVVEYKIPTTIARAAADRRSADRLRIQRDGGSAVILFDLAQPGGYRIEVTDLSGRLVWNHVAKNARAGRQSIACGVVRSQARSGHNRLLVFTIRTVQETITGRSFL